jgi:hypothetical protein
VAVTTRAVSRTCGGHAHPPDPARERPRRHRVDAPAAGAHALAAVRLVPTMGGKGEGESQFHRFRCHTDGDGDDGKDHSAATDPGSPIPRHHPGPCCGRNGPNRPPSLTATPASTDAHAEALYAEAIHAEAIYYPLRLSSPRCPPRRCRWARRSPRRTRTSWCTSCSGRDRCSTAALGSCPLPPAQPVTLSRWSANGNNLVRISCGSYLQKVSSERGLTKLCGIRSDSARAGQRD